MSFHQSSLKTGGAEVDIIQLLHGILPALLVALLSYYHGMNISKWLMIFFMSLLMVHSYHGFSWYPIPLLNYAWEPPASLPCVSRSKTEPFE